MFHPLFYVNHKLVEWPEFVILVLVHLKEKALVILSFSLVKNT